MIAPITVPTSTPKVASYGAARGEGAEPRPGGAAGANSSIILTPRLDEYGIDIVGAMGADLGGGDGPSYEFYVEAGEGEQGLGLGAVG